MRGLHVSFDERVYCQHRNQIAKFEAIFENLEQTSEPVRQTEVM